MTGAHLCVKKVLPTVFKKLSESPQMIAGRAAAGRKASGSGDGSPEASISTEPSTTFINPSSVMTPSQIAFAPTPKAMGSFGVGLLARGAPGAGSREHLLHPASPLISSSTRGRSMSATNLADLGKLETATNPTSMSSTHISSTRPTTASTDSTAFRTPSRSQHDTFGTPRGRSGSLVPTAKKRSSSRSAMDEKKLFVVSGKELALKPVYPKMVQAESQVSEEPLGKFTLAQQEALIMEDLLFVLLGIDGKYIKQINPPKTEEDGYKAPEYIIEKTLDHSLADLTRRIVASAAHYIQVSHFIETHSRFEAGRVAHALVAAMRGVIKDYLVLVAQLEHQVHFAPSFGIHKLWFHLSPSLHVLEALSGLATEVRVAEMAASGNGEGDISILRGVGLGFEGFGGGDGKKRAVVLGVLAGRIVALGGDPVIKQLHLHLLEKSLIPYLQTLRRWIHHGEIYDPCDEFLIQERQLKLTKDQVNEEDFSDVYWDQRYILRRESVPPFLGDGLAERVLRAGKYLNVVRECGIDVCDVEERVINGDGGEDAILSSAAFGDMVAAMDGGRIVDDIDKAYRYANQTLLELLMKDNQLINRLRSIKHYFLLDQSDYLTHFLDIAFPELLKPRSQVSVDRLRSILELSIRNPSSTSSTSDPYKDDLTVELSPYTLIDQLIRVSSMSAEPETTGVSAHIALAGAAGVLTGIDTLMLGCRVGFPVSLVFNRKVMTKYQLLFRHLLHCKHMERLLCSSWMHDHERGVMVTPRISRQPMKRMTNASSAGSLNSGRAVRSAGASAASSTLAPLKPFSGPGRVKVEDEEDERYWKEEREVEKFASRLGVLRARMLHFVQQVMHFTCVDVIDPHWARFEGRIMKVTTVDEVLSIHEDFLDSCLKDGMLTSPNLLKLLNSITTTILTFSNLSDVFFRYRSNRASRHRLRLIPSAATASTAGGLAGTAEMDDLSSPVSLAVMDREGVGRGTSAVAALEKVESQQIHGTRALLNALRFEGVASDASLKSGKGSGTGPASACLFELVTRLDYNDFYSRNFFWSGVGGVGKPVK
ncbi:Gamma-tubulin complex component 2 [Dinochytrium kinnereticum]|nr:Gamma-tubulin complex component 2 [Dinochytrium kinnereticum]